MAVRPLTFIVLVAAALSVAPSFAGESLQFQRGYSNIDGRYNISDGIAILNWLFLGTGTVLCEEAADVNDSGGHDLTDGVYVFGSLFGGGAPPPAPFGECGVDPTPDTLLCAQYDHCVQDPTPPAISDVEISAITQFGAHLSFSTDEAATTIVDYGIDTDYGLQIIGDALATSFDLDFAGLTPGTTYHYRISVTDEAGNTALSTDAMFSTLPAESELTKIGHVLNRIAYGPTAADVERLGDIGVEAYIEEQLDPSSIDESGNDALIAREEALFEELVIHDDTPLVRAREMWRYFKGTVAPPTDWADSGFDDTTWLLGPTGIGYGDGDDLTVLEDMRRVEDDPDTPEVDESQPGYVSVFLRKVFAVADAAAINDLILRVDYDDSFVAYLNGTEVARAGLSGNPPAFDRTGSSHEAGTPVEFDITGDRGLLVDGLNTLAIQVHNTDYTSSDVSMIPELISRVVVDGPPRTVIGGLSDLQKLVHVRGVYSRRQLQAVLAEFWENHFTTDAEKVAEYFDALQNSDATDAMGEDQAFAEAAQVEYQEYQFLYDNALGSFGDLLLFSATSPSMLIYLDNVLNVAGAANENYAREILELFAMGVDNRYEQIDIEQLSKCFTGWTVCKVEYGQQPSFPDSALDPPTECGVQFEDATFLGLGPGWKYFKGTEEPSPGDEGVATTEWTEVGFDDSAWLDGATGIGYGDDDDQTVLDDMRGNYLSVYLRREFTVNDPLEAFENLLLSIDYDD